MPEISESAVVRRMREFQRDLVARDADTIYQMGKQWLRLEQALEANIQLLVMELAELGEEINIATVYKHKRYQKLISQMRSEMEIYNLWAAEYIAENQLKLGVLGIEHGSNLINLSLLEGGSMAFFDKLPVSAVELMVGVAGDGGPIYTLLQEAYPIAVEQMTDVLIQNVALGIGPRQTAKQMMNGVAGSLNHALTVARTEQLRVYREASRQQYVKSGAVQEYMRFASKSGNTCALCLALDGEISKTKEALHVHPNCVIGETPVLAPDIIAGITASYSGPVVEILFSVTRTLTVTPNHMLLTRNGFIKAKNLRKGDKILYYPDFERIVPGDPDDNNSPSAIKDIIRTFAEAPSMATGCVPVSSEYLHGDASLMDGHINIVATNSFLRGDSQSIIAESISQKDFTATDSVFTEFVGKSDLASMLLTLGFAAQGNMRSVGITPSFLRGSLARHQPVGVSASPYFDPVFSKTSKDNRSANSEMLSQGVLGFTGQIPGTDQIIVKDNPGCGLYIDPDLFEPAEHSLVRDPDFLGHTLRSFAGKITETEVVDIRNYDFSGHVYDLHTQSLLYIANGIVSSNCRCTMIPIVNGVKPPQWETGSEWLKKQDMATQQKILGKGAHELWDKGEIELTDLVNKVEHPIWGSSLQRNSLDSLNQ